jgi:hypothetical protein
MNAIIIPHKNAFVNKKGILIKKITFLAKIKAFALV